MRLLKRKRIFTVIVIPHSEDSVFSFRLSLHFLQIFCLVLLGYVVFSMVIYNNYQMAEKKLALMKNIEDENRHLRENIDKLTQETEKLKLQLAEMNVLSSEIKVLAESTPLQERGEIEIFTGRRENEKRTASRGGNSVIDRAQINISLLQQSIPEKNEELKQLKDDLEEYQRKLACTPSIWPAKGKITSRFGQRKSPFNGQNEIHYGLDIAAPHGTSIYAAADGKVIEAAYRRGTGYVIIIDHGYNFKTLYAHLARFNVSKGDVVKKGQVIGYVGSTGYSTGPHLHYEVHVKGVAVNPEEFLGK
ncbi:MAG: peptidoglycan DD-metalloendopeptidase family protein [Firmicutes bacterium]|nr:peptidoglycan DD-metalloendopeptidase family protein [Bacillota bacterium]